MLNQFSKISLPLPLIITTVALTAIILTLCLPLKACAQSKTPKSLIELYTSQGCSSCPPANALLKKYINRKDVIALSLPVDYWDYLGWPDSFGKAQFSNRQRHYAISRGDGQVYTPQIVANGLAHAVGSRPQAVNKVIIDSQRAIAARRIAISVKIKNNQLTISPLTGTARAAQNPNSNQPPTSIWLAMTTKIASVPVPRGENRGKTVTYYNVVRDLKNIGKWNGQALTITLPKNHMLNTKADGCVVFLQQGESGPIIAAAEL